MSRKTVVVLALLVAFAVGVLAPRPARALNTEDTAILASSLAVGYVLFVVGATLLVYGNKPHMMLPAREPLPRKPATHPRVKWAWHCRQPDGNLALACW